MSDATVAAGSDAITLTLIHHGSIHKFSFQPDATLSSLNSAITDRLSIPVEHQKFMVSPKLGLLKPPYRDPNLPLSAFLDKKIQLLAPLPSDLAFLKRPAPRSAPAIKPAKPSRTIDHARAHADITYTFHKIIPLPYLPNPARSARFLERLRDDPGIRAAMRIHKFSVGVLTEMDPAQHTTHESRTLGLNRNQGEVIELRLRTDAYDGYRDYRTIRETLCHELAHNVHGPHDRKFWDLMQEIKREVEKADWTRGGRSVGEEEFYNPEDRDNGVEDVDRGGWSGGEFVVGGSADRLTQGLNRRELMAQAAEARMKKQKEVGKKAEEAQ